MPVADVGNVQSENEDLLVDLAGRAVKEDCAEVIILAGAPLSGLASAVRDRIEVPAGEGVAASVKMVEGLVTLNPRKAISGSFRQPACKSSIGLADALSSLVENGRN